MTTGTQDYVAMARALLDGTLTPQGFSHRAHVGTAYEILARNDVFRALSLYAGGLRKLTETAGVPEKFNATVTFAFISLIAARMAAASHDSAEAFIQANPDLLSKDLVQSYYGPEMLESDLARRVPMLPGSDKADTRT